MARFGYGVAEASRAPRDFEPPVCVLGKITGATAIAGSTTRWEYDWTEASISATNALAAKTNGLTAQKGLSVSELGNTATAVAYGVTLASLPVGMAPVRIPNDTAVLCFPYRRADGSLIWLIVNTQAINGTC
jgi:hypothetical protein